MALLLLLLLTVSESTLSQEIREVELSVNFGEENPLPEDWYLWSENQSDMNYSRMFYNFYKTNKVDVQFRTSCIVNCRMEIINSGELKEGLSPVFIDGIQAFIRLLMNLSGLSPASYELSLYLRSGDYPGVHHNIIRIFRKDSQEEQLVDRVFINTKDGFIDGQIKRFPIDIKREVGDVAIRLESESRKFILSGFKLTKFKERYRINEYLRLVDLEDIDQGYSYRDRLGNLYTVCGAFYGRDILLGAYNNKAGACAVVAHGGFFNLKHFKILKWDSNLSWSSKDTPSKVQIVTLRDSYFEGLSTYCMVKFLNGVAMGRINNRSMCEYIEDGRLKTAEDYATLVRTP